MITKPKATMCACGQPVHKGARCRECFNAAHKAQQAARRAKADRRCIQCGRKCGAQAKRCRICNGGHIKEVVEQRREAPRVPTVAWCPTGLRGPGGAMELELQVPTVYRSGVRR